MLLIHLEKILVQGETTSMIVLTCSGAGDVLDCDLGKVRAEAGE